MAGGTFNPLTGKDRPGTYINFTSTKTDTIGIGERGIVVIPLLNHSWGPTGEFVRLTADAPDAHRKELGFSIYDDDANHQMLLIREAFKKAAVVYVYRCNGGSGAAATASPTDSQPATATAKHKGTRGNKLSYSIVSNPAVTNGFDVTISLDGSVVSEYTGLKTVADLIAQNDEYITFTGTGNLTATAGVNLTGGTDVAADNSAVTTFLDSLESIRFNTLAFPSTEATLQSAAKTKIKYIRENIGRGVQVVMPDTAAKDYEGVINVTNAVKVGDISLTHAEACAWVAAATAAAGNNKSNTYEAYEGATEVVDPKTHEQAVAAIKNGEFFFSVSEAGTVVVEYDINSLTSYTSGGKDKSYRKNRVIRVFDTFAESIQLNFPPNRFSNDEVGWGVMEGLGRAILKQFENAGAITEVDYEKDFLVDRGRSEADETYFNVGLKPVDSAEKLYFQIATR